MAQLNNDNVTCCYTDKDINILLQNLSKGDYIVSEAANEDHNCLQKIVDNACKQLKNDRKMIPAVVIPVNINSNEDGSFYGSHWIGLVVLLDDKKTLKAVCIDSLCSCTKSIITIHKCLFENGVKSILSYNKQQNNLCDTGPWTVFNLDSFARTGELEKGVFQESFLNQRAHLTSIAREFGVKNFFFKKSKMPFREIKETDREKNRSRDVMKLEEMLSEIRLFEEKGSDLRKMLCRIGYLSGEISREDKRDPTCNDIRNTYGYIKRNSVNNVINKNGIYFEKLLQLKILLENENLYDPISQTDLQKLEESVLGIKQQILQVLQQEKYYISHQDTLYQLDRESVTSSISIGPFIEIISVYYNQLLFSRIKHELLLLEDIDFKIESNRYVTARVFTNLGDLANEFVEDLTNKDNALFGFFKNLYTVRNKIIHCHKKIKYEQDNEVNKTFLKVRDSLDKCILPNRSLDIQCVPDSGDMDSLKKYFKKAVKTAESESVLREEFIEKEGKKEKIRYSLDSLIFQASKIIRGIAPNRMVNQIDNRLERLNRGYISQLELMDEADTVRYPKMLNLANQALIIKHSQLNIPMEPCAVSEIGKKNIANKIMFANLKIKWKVEDVNEEIEYLSSMLSDREVEQARKSHVIEHIELIVSQYVRDLDESNGDTHTQQMICETSVIHKLLANVNSANQIRTVFSGQLLSRLIDGFLDNRDSIDYLFTTGDYRMSPIVAITRCNTGVSFSKLGLYQQAIGFLEKAAEDVKYYKRPSGVEVDGDYLHSVCGIDRYRLHIGRTLANVLTLSGQVDKATEIFRKLCKKIMKMLDLVKEHRDDEITTEVVNFFIDYFVCLRDQCKFEEAVKICEQAMRMSDGVRTSVCLTEAYYKSGRFDQAARWRDKTMESSRDEVGKFTTLETLVMVYLTSPDPVRGLEDAELCVEKMEMILQANTNLFREIFNGRHLLAKLKIIYASLILKPERNSLSPELENEVKSLIGELGDNFKRDPTIALIQMVFCWIFSMDSTQSGLDKAREYFDLAVKTVNGLPKCLPIIALKLQETGDVLASAYTCCSVRHSERLGEDLTIQNLNVALDLQKSHKLSRIATLTHFSRYRLYLAKTFLAIYNGHAQLVDKKKSVQHFQDAIKFARHQLLEHRHEDDLKTLTNRRKLTNRSCGDVGDIRHESVLNLAFSYHKLADLQFDTEYVKAAILYYDILLGTSVAVDRIVGFQNCKEECEIKIGKFEYFLRGLIHFNGNLELAEIDVWLVEVCSRKFKIELRLQDGMVFWENFDNQHQEVIQNIEEELRVIHNYINRSD